VKRCLGLAAAVALTGCAQLPLQPVAGCEPTRTLFVVSHGWHSGIVVESAELAKRLPGLHTEAAKYLEIGWGEERFYRARDTSAWMALRAVLSPNPSVLQVVSFAEPPRSYFSHSETAEVRTDEAGYARVLDFIAANFSPGLERLGASLYGSGAFYRAEGSFHLFNTCNDWVARALEQASCR
jgi:uncharacterized protein (TIGR02117 family)